jgi:archaellum component FlaC
VKTKSKHDDKNQVDPVEKEHKKAEKSDEKEKGREEETGASSDFEAVKPEGKFADGSEIIAVLQPPQVSAGANIQQLVEEAGWQVTAVDWAFEKVTGQSLVETVIMPITGDFNKIQCNAEAWRTIADSMTQFSATMSGNADIVGSDWKGQAATAHKLYVDVGFKAGFLVESKVAGIIAKGFDAVADGSKKLCAKALDLLKTLVDKVIDAISKSWIPAYGWVRAAELIWDAYQLYQKIIEIIDMVKEIIQKVGEMWSSIQNIGSQLAKIKEIRSIGDAKQFAKDLSGDVKDVKNEFNDVKSTATDIRDTATDIRNTATGSDDTAPEEKTPETKQPSATQPSATQHPAAQHPAAQHPATEHPATQHPATQPSATQHPAAQHPATQHPAAQHPAAQHPATPASRRGRISGRL